MKSCRVGCVVCRTELGNFQYKIGLCNRCRKVAAKRKGVKPSKIVLSDVPHATYHSNLTDEQRDSFLSGV